MASLIKILIVTDIDIITYNTYKNTQSTAYRKVYSKDAGVPSFLRERNNYEELQVKLKSGFIERSLSFRNTKIQISAATIISLCFSPFYLIFNFLKIFAILYEFSFKAYSFSKVIRILS